MSEDFIRTTEASSLYNDIEQYSISEILFNINREDQKVPLEVKKVIPQVSAMVEVIAEKMQKGGRLFYIGAGTSGRLAVVDASECPPTFGVPHGLVIAIIAGGYQAMFKAVENAEDNTEQAWLDLQEHSVSTNDFVVGIAASGTTPYVIHGLKNCREAGIATGSISCNVNAPLSKQADLPIEVLVGPEFITGSTRMKSGTAQKLVLNMISTAVMIRLGRIKGNKMVNMQLTNQKLFERGTRMIMDELKIEDKEKAAELLKNLGSVKKVMEQFSI
jgi:N-acetylmuramic acid 6-phosphate etherase